MTHGPSEDRCIGLLGPFGYGNLGDAAIVDAMLASIRRNRPTWRVRAYTLDPVDTRRRHGIVSHPLGRQVLASGATGDATNDAGGAWSRGLARMRASPRPWLRRLERVVARVPIEVGLLLRAHRSLAGVDMLVWCGSGQIQDMWGGGGPWSSPYTALRWTVLARLRGAHVAVVSVGAGPVDKWLSRRFYRWALALTCYRSFRDEWSRRYVAERIGLDRGDPVVPDLAFGLRFAARPAPSRPGRTIGVAPIGYLRPGNWPTADPERHARYLGVVVDVVVAVLARGDRVRLLVGEARYDRRVVADVVAALEDRGVDRSRLDDAPIETVDDLLDAVAECDVVLTSRLHNVLLAYLLGRPAVALSYQAKTEALMSSFGQGHLCMPIDAADAGEVICRLHAALAQPGFGEHAAAVVARRREEVELQDERLFDLV